MISIYHFPLLGLACLPYRIPQTRIAMKMIWKARVTAKAMQLQETREKLQMTQRTQRKFAGTAT